MWPTSAAALLLLAAASGTGAAPLLDPASLEDAHRGLDHLYNARIEPARASFERIRERHPESPATDFLLGGIEWHRVSTGPAGFTAGGSAERSFFARMDAAIELGEKAVRDDPRDASARFFLGGAYGYKARYLAIQEKWWDAYRTGRRGVKHLERVVKQDPDLGDAYLGLGIYHYYADVLPGVLKFLGNFVGIDGDRERGLREIRRALAHGALVNVECRFFLAEIHTTFEKDHWRGLGYSRSLRDEYPENELFAWLNARILDELHLGEQAAAEWRLLRAKPRDRSLSGFLDYRLARSRHFGGDFAGAAVRFGELLEDGTLGSRRITMWGRLRYGACLDFLGRHEEAMEQYRLARDLDASSTAKDRASDRLAAGRKDPGRVSLRELAETVRILKGTRGHGEEALRRVENQVTGPSRGLSSRDRDVFFGILHDLAEARLRRGDPNGCRAAVARALDTWQTVPRDWRSTLAALRARALFREGRAEEGLAEIEDAWPRAGLGLRRRLDRQRELMRPATAAAAPVSPPDGEDRVTVTFSAPDRGEIRLEVEGNFLPRGARIPLSLEDGTWSAIRRVAGADTLHYRFVTDGARTRIDPKAPYVILVNDEAWSVRPVP